MCTTIESGTVATGKNSTRALTPRRPCVVGAVRHDDVADERRMEGLD